MGKKNKENLNQVKPVGRVKKTEADFDKNFSNYQERMNIRVSNGENIKVLDREAWDKSKPSGETSSEIFVRLTKSRMPKILKGFNNISAIAKYVHTDEQKEKVLSDLNKAVEKVKIAFEPKPEKKEEVEEEYQI